MPPSTPTPTPVSRSTANASVFALPARLAPKADPALVADDEQHFAAIAACLDDAVADVSARLDAARRSPGGSGTLALERDQEIHRLSGRLRTLRAHGLDLCLGRVVPADGSEPVHIGRLGLTDRSGRRLLVDWRSPTAEPFFRATDAHPMGLASRRRYRWTQGRISDYWDEVFLTVQGSGPGSGAGSGSRGAGGAGGLASSASLDDQSAFIASLGAERTPRMRDVLGTIQADQDAIVRAGSESALVVDGGPGTGKTVVALHRAAYLLYSEPRLRAHHGGVLVVGPHQPYLDYVEDVLPSLGEEGVQICTLRDLVPEGAKATVEADPAVARLKASARMVEAIEPAVRLYERPPRTGTTVETPWLDLWLSADDWAEAFDSPDPGTPHNEARDVVWEALIEILMDRLGDGEDEGELPLDLVRRSLATHRDLARTLNTAWPLLEPTDLVGDLWDVPAYLRMCAPWLTPDEVRSLQRDEPQAWTVSDLPLLDAARQRLGDPEASRRRRQHAAQVAAEREEMSNVVDHLIATDDSELQVMSMLRGQDLRDALVDDAALPDVTPDPLAGPFAHVVVDEAQELTDAEWQMLLLRCPSRSLTVVGDRAQARHGFTESWRERLERVGVSRVEVASLTINYRTPQEVMAEAEPVIRAALPDANVPTSVRSGHAPVLHGVPEDLDGVLETWLAEHQGVACVVGDPAFRATERVRSLTPVLAKGLEFDLVVLVDPASFGEGDDSIAGAVDRYVAMTRATQQLVILAPGAASLSA
ncbi:RNA polymerase recycling motor ATPase HelR [Oerskovia jenensis]|uniref:DNA helicase IV n=1 Tax=Oerskovia jenensis TaxID=162169 RepID=A0ABS2LAG2_9CELL|nr:RNA polymerase recycling motor ATPase HelR [Oerskovia jenensis]MBM7477401.1 DNA helicase IV [Oerskovia jenensis]